MSVMSQWAVVEDTDNKSTNNNNLVIWICSEMFISFQEFWLWNEFRCKKSKNNVTTDETCADKLCEVAFR